MYKQHICYSSFSVSGLAPRKHLCVHLNGNIWGKAVHRVRVRQRLGERVTSYQKLSSVPLLKHLL